MSQNPFSDMADSADTAAPSSNLSQGAAATPVQATPTPSPQNGGGSLLSSIAGMLGSISAEGNADKTLTNPMMNIHSAPQPSSSKENEKDERKEMAKDAAKAMVFGM